MLSFRDGMISDRGNRNRGMKTDHAKTRCYQLNTLSFGSYDLRTVDHKFGM